MFGFKKDEKKAAQSDAKNFDNMDAARAKEMAIKKAAGPDNGGSKEDMWKEDKQRAQKEADLKRAGGGFGGDMKKGLK